MDPASTANFILPLFALVVWTVAAIAWAQRRAMSRAPTLERR
jgi:hypothetical protein